jgi:alkyl hydroperoxide reductase subunit AhpC
LPASTRQQKWTIYEDDVSFGKRAPSLGTAEPIKGTPPTLGEKPTLVMFFAKSHKGDYTTIVDVSDLADKYGEFANFVGIGIDADKKDTEGLLKKVGKAMPNEYIPEFRVNFPLVWDAGKECKEAYRNVAKVMTITPSACFLVDTDKKIVWREQFGQGYEPRKGQIGEQLRRLIMGEELIKNGPTPVADESDDEEEEMAMGDGSEEDSDLGF